MDNKFKLCGGKKSNLQKVFSMVYRLSIIFLSCFLVISCNRNNYVMAPKASVEKVASEKLMSDSLTKKFNSGIEFYARGNDPIAWSLTMDLEGEFSFIAPGNNLSLIAKTGKETNEGIEYLLTDVTGTMMIRMLKATCEDGKSKQIFVTVNQKIYKGCGQALYDKNLEGPWQLLKIKNKSQDNAQYKNGIPEIVFQTSNTTLKIFTGCEQTEVTYQISGNKLTIPSVPGGKCTNDFIQILNSKFYGYISTYYIKENLLFIYLIDDSIITFKKK